MTADQVGDLPEALPVLGNWVRGALVGIVLGLLTVFVIAWLLNPYDADGTPRRQETHRQLGLPPCTFYEVTGIPCPSCGMTTSFSLLVHGDPLNSLRANSVGTLLALFCLAFIPWAVGSVVKRRPLFIRSLERGFLVVLLTLVGLMTLRWLLVLAAVYWGGTSLGI